MDEVHRGSVEDDRFDRPAEPCFELALESSPGFAKPSRRRRFAVEQRDVDIAPRPAVTTGHAPEQVDCGQAVESRFRQRSPELAENVGDVHEASIQAAWQGLRGLEEALVWLWIGDLDSYDRLIGSLGTPRPTPRKLAGTAFEAPPGTTKEAQGMFENRCPDSTGTRPLFPRAAKPSCRQAAPARCCSENALSPRRVVILDGAPKRGMRDC